MMHSTKRLLTLKECHLHPLFNPLWTDDHCCCHGPQWEPTPHSRDCHPQHRRCRPVVPPAGDPHRCGNGEKDPRPRQEHKVRQIQKEGLIHSIDMYLLYLHCPYCCCWRFGGLSLKRNVAKMTFERIKLTTLYSWLLDEQQTNTQCLKMRCHFDG